MAVGLIDELLEIVTLPVTEPDVVGANATYSAAVWPGFRVTGSLSPVRLNPAPVTLAELTVTAAVPAELRVMD